MSGIKTGIVLTDEVKAVLALSSLQLAATVAVLIVMASRGEILENPGTVTSAAISVVSMLAVQSVTLWRLWRVAKAIKEATP